VPTYSFVDTNCTIVGPGLQVVLGAGSGAAEGGITFEMAEDKDTQRVGADGTVMHSLHAGQMGVAIVRLQKTSPNNAQLMVGYNAQRTFSTNWGGNVITLTTIQGDNVTCRGVAFQREPNKGYDKEGADMEWRFNVGTLDSILGTYAP
jgi:hypothetical protein